MVVLACGLLVGCSRPVAVPPPSAEPGTEQTCQQFVAALPAELSTVGSRREVSPESGVTAAYGDPPVAVRCGVPVPAALSASSELVEVDGVTWFPEELTAGWIMTTVDLPANVEVTVPDSQGPAPSVAADLAATILSTMAALTPTPTP